MRRLLIGALFMLAAPLALAHGGGMDAHGCHNDRSAGDYHCHSGAANGRSFDSKADALASGAFDASTEPSAPAPRARSDRSGASGGAYDRDLYDHWIDADGDCQDTRQEVLISQGRGIRLESNGCRVASGTWMGPYTDRRYSDPSDLHIDHVVPLAEAHRSGAAGWSAARKREFANDMDNLLAVEAGENMSKGADDPASWLPDSNRCEYVSRWIRVKKQWGLSADRAEVSALEAVLSGCR